MGNEVGNEKGVVGPQSPHFSSLMWLGVVYFSFPSLSIHHLKHVEVPMDGSESYYWPFYVTSGWAMHNHREWIARASRSACPSWWPWQEVKGEVVSKTTSVGIFLRQG